MSGAKPSNPITPEKFVAVLFNLDGVLTATANVHAIGKPRFDGGRGFLRSRSLDLPKGTPNDTPQTGSVCGLGNRKNEMINAVIESDRVEAYEGSLALVRQIRQEGIKVAVVTSSQNCEAVLKAAGIANIFKVRVDGTVIHDRNLSGKPAPDGFLAAAKSLGVDPKRAVVVEDAISGVPFPLSWLIVITFVDTDSMASHMPPWPGVILITQENLSRNPAS